MALHEVDNDLKRAEATLRHWETKYPEVARREARAKLAYELARADVVAQINAKHEAEGKKPPTIPVIEAEAMRKCRAELTEMSEAEVDANIAKKLIGIAETMLSSIQSRTKLEILEMGLTR